ncbi:MAG: hypothetical protein WAX63_16720 [Rhodoferax sp.]
MRIVGHKNTGLNQPPATPEEAWQRGRVLDAMLPNLLPVPRGVSRLTHAQRNAQYCLVSPLWISKVCSKPKQTTATKTASTGTR